MIAHDSITMPDCDYKSQMHVQPDWCIDKDCKEEKSKHEDSRSKHIQGVSEQSELTPCMV